MYVDLDDVLCQTITAIIAWLEREQRRVVSVEDFVHFDLGLSLGLDEVETVALLDAIHEPSVLGGMGLVQGARRVLVDWEAGAWEVAIMTGRPPSSAAPTRTWLGDHEIPHARLDFVDKYGRNDPAPDAPPALTLDDLSRMQFVLAVEDSLSTAAFLASDMGVPVALMDRPWNRDVSRVPAAARSRIRRCSGWEEVAALAAEQGVHRGEAVSSNR